MGELRAAVIGFGLAGRFFHAPLITACAGLEVGWIVTSSRERAAQASLAYSAARIVPAVAALWPERPDLVVVATANEAHAPLARTALEHGIPVVIDKPMAVTAEEAETVIALAADRGVMLTVFQNRRWDTDILTLRRLLAQDALGSVTRFESRFERWRPEADAAKWRESVPPERGGGQLLDLGAHLVDQALTLFGPARTVYGEVAARRGSSGDDDAFVAIRHVSGPVSHLHASAVCAAPGPRLRVQGTKGAFVVGGLDPQEDALRAGRRPDTDLDWGCGEDWERGRFVVGEQSVPVPPVPGRWQAFYAGVERAIREGSPPPVDARDAVATLHVIEAARRSAAEKAVITL